MIEELQNIKEQLFDASKEVKESFNNIVKYFEYKEKFPTGTQGWRGIDEKAEIRKYKKSHPEATNEDIEIWKLEQRIAVLKKSTSLSEISKSRKDSQIKEYEERIKELKAKK